MNGHKGISEEVYCRSKYPAEREMRGRINRGGGRRQAERRERRLGEDKPVQVRPARLRGKKQKNTRR